MNKAKKDFYDKLGASVVKALESRHFESYYCPTAEAAKEKVLSLIPEGKSVGWGGSMTLDETGILPAIKIGNYEKIDRDNAKTPQERKELMLKALTADYFMMSANAISKDGVIYNLDGNGNRAAAMVYGPENVIVVAGLNKIAASQEDELLRTRNCAAPMNAQRFDIKTPCKTTGECANCKCVDSICANFVITRLCRPAGRIKVILVGEDFGF